MSFAGLCNSKVNIIRVIKSAAGALGGWEDAKNVLHLNLPCRINWTRGSERIFFDKGTYFRDAKLFCKVIDVTIKDKVEYKGKLYNIVDVNNVDEADRFLVLDLKLVE